MPKMVKNGHKKYPKMAKKRQKYQIWEKMPKFPEISKIITWNLKPHNLFKSERGSNSFSVGINNAYFTIYVSFQTV